jgi:hypothetical protein
MGVDPGSTQGLKDANPRPDTGVLGLEGVGRA